MKVKEFLKILKNHNENNEVIFYNLKNHNLKEFQLETILDVDGRQPRVADWRAII